MDIETYEQVTDQTWKPPTTISPIQMCVLGMVEELGEIAGKLKRVHRDHEGRLFHDQVEKIKLESGDFFYYFTRFCKLVGYTMEEMMQANADKILDRMQRGVLQGEGDER